MNATYLISIFGIILAAFIVLYGKYEASSQDEALPVSGLESNEYLLQPELIESDTI